MALVTLYGKPDCHLCTEARAVVLELLRERDFELEEIDIHSDPALLGAYFDRIPVVAIDGEEAFEFFVDRSRLAALIDRADGRGDDRLAFPQQDEASG